MNKLNILIYTAITSFTLFLCTYYLENQYHYISRVTDLTHQNVTEYATLQYKHNLTVAGSTILCFLFIAACIGIVITIIDAEKEDK